MITGCKTKQGVISTDNKNMSTKSTMDLVKEAKEQIENDYFKEHYKHICESDAVLVVNDEKNGVKNYIGGNVLIELGQAYVHNKKIFFLNGITADVPYLDEIIALQPICLEGDLQTINNRSY